MAPVTDQRKPAQECAALGCQRSVADKLIQELRRENSELRAGRERVCAQLEVAQAGYRSAVEKAEWQARTNAELNDLQKILDRYRKAMDAIYNHNEAARAAVIQHFGDHHE